jgi:hypothetical protein
MNTIKKYWKAIIGVIGSIIGFILLRQFMQRDLKAALKNAETGAKSAVLDERANSLNRQASDLSIQNETLKAYTNKPASLVDPKAAEDYWKKN